MNRISRKMAQDLEDMLLLTMYGGKMPEQRKSAVCLRNGRIETVQLDDKGNIIEPPPRCWKCGPVILCAEHFMCT